MKHPKKLHDLEITKILAKTMQSSYKKKQINELTLRILHKIEAVMEISQSSNDIEALKSEFMALKQEAYSFIKP